MKGLIRYIVVISTIILIIGLFVGGSKVYSSSYTFTVSASKTRVKPGESTIVSMKISNIVDSNGLGINAVESILEYDSNILEVVTASDMEGKNNWTITYNFAKNNFLVSNIIAGVKEEQVIGEIKFKVRENVGKTRTIIRFKNNKSNDGNNLMYEVDREIELIIDDDDDNNKGLEQISTGSTNNVVGGNSKIDLKTDIAANPIPKTGANTKAVCVISIIFLIAVLLYIRYKTIDK